MTARLGVLLLCACAAAQAGPRSAMRPRPQPRPLNTTWSVPEPTAVIRAAPFPIEWRESREIAAPGLVSLIRNYKRDGLPVLPLWQSTQSRLAIGLNPHGVPGIYFTHHVGE